MDDLTKLLSIIPNMLLGTLVMLIPIAILLEILDFLGIIKILIHL